VWREAVFYSRASGGGGGGGGDGDRIFSEEGVVYREGALRGRGSVVGARVEKSVNPFELTASRPPPSLARAMQTHR
jgi:hypothetical protein